MREILFRAKRADNSNWVYGFLVSIFIDPSPITGEKDIEVKTAIQSNHNSYKKSINYQIIPETVGQFTGLTDKNGVKIFEGDIVKHWAWKENFEVSYSKRACFMCFSKDGMVNNIYSNQLVIIGNIHDNPELL